MTSNKESTVSGGDYAINNNTKSTDANKFNATRTNSPSTQNQDFCTKLSQSCDGTTTGSSEGGHLSLNRGNFECQQLYEGSESRTDPKRTQSSPDQGTFQAAACQPNKSDSTDLQDKETSRTTRATQIYLKQKEMGTHPPFVLDTEEVDLLVFNFVQSIVQQTQQHMLKQLEQCMQ